MLLVKLAELPWIIAACPSTTASPSSSRHSTACDASALQPKLKPAAIVFMILQDLQACSHRGAAEACPSRGVRIVVSNHKELLL